jgi:hypothetical protein
LLGKALQGRVPLVQYVQLPQRGLYLICSSAGYR